MSADNYLYVRRTPENKWTVTMEFVSNDCVRDINDNDPRYETRDQAIDAASKWMSEDIIEYGMVIDKLEDNNKVGLDDKIDNEVSIRRHQTERIMEYIRKLADKNDVTYYLVSNYIVEYLKNNLNILSCKEN